MEIYLKQKGLFYTITKTCTYTCIERLDKNTTRLVEIHSSPTVNGFTILHQIKNKSYLDVQKDQTNFEESNKEEFMEAYKNAMNSIHTFQLSINKK